jgi:uncharacterized membrane protein YhaH (DUF805 family)
VADPRTPTRHSPLLWLFVSFRGRISRGIYWLAYGVLLCVNAVLVGQLIGGSEASFSRLADAVAPFVILATLYANVSVAVKRLHDMGYSGFIAIALFVPFVNFAFTIWVGLVPGTGGPNSYGQVVDTPPA